jgi:MFS family permease
MVVSAAVECGWHRHQVPPNRPSTRRIEVGVPAPATLGTMSSPAAPPISARRRSRGERGDTYASLRIPAYRTLFTVGAFGFLATQSQVIARGWLANELADSNTGLGGVFMAFGIPMLIATPLGGVAADRYSKRRILIVTFGLLVLSSLWIGLGVSFDFIAYWMALTGEVVGRELIPNAIILGQLTINGARVVGPAMAGLFIGIAWIGVAGVYYVSAALSAIAIFGCLRLPPGLPSTARTDTSVRDEFHASLRYVWKHRPVGLLIIVSFVVVMVGFPFVAFLPRFATEVLDVGSAGYGFLAAASAVGAVALSMAIAGRSKGRAAWRIQSVTGVLFGVFLVVLGWAPGYLAAVIAVAAVGAASAGFQAMNNSLVLQLSDLEYHGRVQSLMMLSFSGFGMAALPLGVLADAIGLRETLAIMGATVVVAMAVYLVVASRGRRRFDDAAV